MFRRLGFSINTVAAGVTALRQTRTRFTKVSSSSDDDAGVAAGSSGGGFRGSFADGSTGAPAESTVTRPERGGRGSFRGGRGGRGRGVDGSDEGGSFSRGGRGIGRGGGRGGSLQSSERGGGFSSPSEVGTRGRGGRGGGRGGSEASSSSFAPSSSARSMSSSFTRTTPTSFTQSRHNSNTNALEELKAIKTSVDELSRSLFTTISRLERQGVTIGNTPTIAPRRTSSSPEDEEADPKEASSPETLGAVKKSPMRRVLEGAGYKAKEIRDAPNGTTSYLIPSLWDQLSIEEQKDFKRQAAIIYQGEQGIVKGRDQQGGATAGGGGVSRERTPPPTRRPPPSSSKTDDEEWQSPSQKFEPRKRHLTPAQLQREQQQLKEEHEEFEEAQAPVDDLSMAFADGDDTAAAPTEAPNKNPRKRDVVQHEEEEMEEEEEEEEEEQPRVTEDEEVEQEEEEEEEDSLGSEDYAWEKDFLLDRGVKPHQISLNPKGGYWFADAVLQGELSKSRLTTWRKRMVDFAAKNKLSCSNEE